MCGLTEIVKVGSIYAHTHRDTGKVYIGQTWQSPESRWASQRNETLRWVLKHRYFQAALRKYGWDAFDHTVVATASSSETLNELEKLWIWVLRTTDRSYGYNLALGGSNGHVGLETKALMSLAAKCRKGRFCSPKTRAKISAAQKGIPKPASLAHIHAHRDSPKVLANCRALGAAHKGKPWSAARRLAQNTRQEVVHVL